MRDNTNNSHPTILYLRVDIDIASGLNQGAPRLLKLFSELGITASFFIPSGPDRSGIAIKRVITRPGFLRRMWRLKAPSTYGVRALFSGVLLPPIYLISKGRDILKQIMEQGHELGLHGYDHFYWQDNIDRLPKEEIDRMISLGFAEFERYLSRKPEGFASPGWIYNAQIAEILDSYNLLYSSDCRGRAPFFPKFPEYQAKTLQIPTTLPTMDELIVLRKNSTAYALLTQKLFMQKRAVHTIHAEIEGGRGFPDFQKWLESLMEMGDQKIRFDRMDRFAKEKIREQEYHQNIPIHAVQRGSLPGRFDSVAIQS
ncbi:MAG: hypothetical protein B6244_00185 [Candidatus Cloacimonetes bacterium 4572_55]|nr:MAG: hypothetical protein B6244_00185 [Candidatus Cloacimonetes bacterium 4572_55]